MKISYLITVPLMAAAIVASPLALSAPGHGAEITHFLSTSNSIYGIYAGDTQYAHVVAQVFDDMSGVMQGRVFSEMYDSNTENYSLIDCYGPAYANSVTLNKTNGNSNINATLDPSDSNCYSENVNAPVTINLTGQYDGYHYLQGNGTNKEMLNDSGQQLISKYNFKEDTFSETFTGTTGFYTGTLTGEATVGRNNDRKQLK